MNFGTVLSAANFAMNAQRMAQPQGIGSLNGPNILNDLPVHAGSVVEWTGELLLADGAKVERPNPGNAQQVANDFAAMLYTGGWFSDVQVSYSGWFSVSFTARVTTGTGFGRLADLRSIFEGVAWQTSTSGWPHLAAQTSNLFVVSVPRGVVVRQPGSTAPDSAGSCSPGYEWSWLAYDCVPSARSGGNQSGQSNPNIAPPKCPHPTSLLCDCGEEWSMLKLACVPIDAADDGKNFFDGLAEWLGVTPSQAVIVGALIAVVGVVAVKRII